MKHTILMEIPGHGDNLKRYIINTYLYEYNEYKIKYYKLRYQLLTMGLICKTCDMMLAKWELQYTGYEECMSCKLYRYKYWIIKIVQLIIR